MSNRPLRVSELIQREISAYLHTHYQVESVRLTITGVVVSPDFHDGRVFYAVVGDKELAGDCGRWLREKAGEIRSAVGKQIVLKRLPRFEFVHDETSARGARVLQVLDEIDAKERPGT